MTNIYLIDSDEKAIRDFVKDHKELYDETNEHFKDKARKGCLGRGLPTVASCLSRWASPGLSCKGHVTASSHNPSLVSPQKR